MEPECPICAIPRVVVADLGRRLHVLRPLRDRLRVLRHVEPRAEGRVDAALEVERLVPGGDVLEQVRQVHVRPVSEVAARAEVGVPERLQVRDPGRTVTRLLRGGEAEEELGTVGDELRPVDARRDSHLLREARPAVEPAADEPLPDARDGEEAAQVVEERLRARRDVLERVAPEEDGEVVRLEPRRLRGRSGTGSRPRARAPRSRGSPTPAGRRAGGAPSDPARIGRSTGAPMRP